MEGEPRDPKSPETSREEAADSAEPPPPFRPLTHLIVDMEGGRSEDQRKAQSEQGRSHP
jgi:hypothetical protein